MNLVIKVEELEKLGVWDKFAKMRKLPHPEAYTWGWMERKEFELTEVEIKELNIGLTLNDKHYNDLSIQVNCDCCKVYFSIFIRDLDKFWFCPSCGDKLTVPH